MKHFFSLVTTCWNEINSVKNWQNNINNQTQKPDEIVIVDNFSSDGTYEILKDWADKDNTVKVIQQRCTVAQGRNLAISSSKSRYIVSTDMGVRLEPKWFEEITSPFDDEHVDVVVGNYMNDPHTVDNYWAKVEGIITKGGKPNLSFGFLPSNRSVAYKIEVWRELNGYPEDLSCATDDTIFGMEIYHRKFNIAFQPKAMVYWGRHSNLKGFCKEKFNYGKGEWRSRYQ